MVCLNNVKSGMKRHIIAAIFVTIFAGCGMTPSRAPIAGFYASNPVHEEEDWKWADGRSHTATRDLTLTLYPNGDYRARWEMYHDGELVHFSGLMPYDFQTNSTGTWTLSNGRLLLRSSGPAYIVTAMMLRQQGGTVTPEESEAAVSFRDGHWIIVWNQTEYLSRKEVLPNPQAATAYVTPNDLPPWTRQP
jgi:hypothetical protein